MSDAVSALAGASAAGIVRIEEAGLVGMVTIRGELSDAAFRNAVTSETGATIPEQSQRTTIGENALVWMSPDELLLTCPHEAAPKMAAKLSAAFGRQHALATNVSDARAMFHLTGEGAAIRDTLAKLTPADLRPSVLPVNAVRRTRLAQVAAAIWFDSEGRATVVCFRSVAQYVFDLIKASAAPGSEVGFFRG